MTIICVANQKGGVGKTTTAVTLADLAARAGKTVLLIDLDSQGNVADSLGIESGPDLCQWLLLGQHMQAVTIATRTRLDIIRSDKTTARLVIGLAGMDFRENVLRAPLDEDRHELVILDCAPSVDILHTAALVAADLLLIPTRLDQYSVKGVTEIMRSLMSVKRATDSRCKLAGIIPTFYDRSTRESQAQLANLARAFPLYVWPMVPVDTKCREAHRYGKTLEELDPTCRALTGVTTTDGKTVGGYNQIYARLRSLL